MQLIRVEAPGAPVVSLDDMKLHLGVDHNDHDSLIEKFTAAATEEIDGSTGIGRALIDQTWDGYLEEFCDSIEIPLSPLIEIESVKYYDENNAQQTLSASVYEVIGAGGHSPAKLVLAHNQSWPSLYNRKEPVVIRFRAGYVDLSGSPEAGAVPAKIIQAIKLITGTLYAQRENIVVGQSVAELPTVKNLLNKFIVYSF